MYTYATCPSKKHAILQMVLKHVDNKSMKASMCKKPHAYVQACKASCIICASMQASMLANMRQGVWKGCRAHKCKQRLGITMHEAED